MELESLNSYRFPSLCSHCNGPDCASLEPESLWNGFVTKENKWIASNRVSIAEVYMSPKISLGEIPVYFACLSNPGALFTFSFIHLSINHVSTAPLCFVAELCHLLHLRDPMSLFTLPDVIWIIAIFYSLPEILMLAFCHSAVVIYCHSYFL